MLASSTDLSEAPELQDQIEKYSVDVNRFKDTKTREYPVKDDNPFYVKRLLHVHS